MADPGEQSLQPTVRDCVDAVATVYPPDLAEPWDAVGLVCGVDERQVSRVMVAVDPTEAVVREALDWSADLLLVHHPLLLSPVSAIPASDPRGAVLTALLEHRCGLLTAHTNADAAEPGVSDALAQLLGVRVDGPLEASFETSDDLLLITYVPEEHLDTVVDALAQRGAGAVGDYRRCAFTSSGMGTFEAPRDGNPFIGVAGERATAHEVRIEMTLPSAARLSVVEALLATHPYEEPAYWLAPSAQRERSSTGIGRVGSLAEPTTVGEFTRRVAERLPATAAGVKVAGPLDQPVRRVAVCGGSGDSLLGATTGVDVYVTSDLKHHRVLDHLAAGGCPVIDTAHWASEWPWCQQAVDLVGGTLEERGWPAGSVEFRISSIRTDPWTGHRGSTQ